MRLRAQVDGDKTTVRVVMAHEMETGLRRDDEGRLVPAWFIQDVSARLNGRLVMSARWGPSVSKNPYLQFNLKGAKVGDKIAITWVDNTGDTRTDETTAS